MNPYQLIAIFLTVDGIILALAFGIERIRLWVNSHMIAFIGICVSMIGFQIFLFTKCAEWNQEPPREPEKKTIVELPKGPIEKPPKEPIIIKNYDFEDGTTQGWGVYDGTGRVVASADVIAKSEEFAEGRSCLRVDNINIKAESQTGAAFKKWLAVRYEGSLILTNAKLVASVYTPAGAGFNYADARFFLFLPVPHDPNDKKWCQSGTEDEGVLLEPGRWVELAWDLRLEETRQWPSPWPWRNILGIQIYVEGTFKGPVYIDNVTITVPN